MGLAAKGGRAQRWASTGRQVQWRDIMDSQIPERTEIKFAGDRGTVQCLGHFRESLDLLGSIHQQRIERSQRERLDCKPSFAL